MHWYRSGQTTVGFQIKSTQNLPSSFVIPAFTMVSNANKDIVYTTLEPVVLYTDSTMRYNIVNTPAIEGHIEDYKINGDIKIDLNNLDNDMRLYFTKTNIAENGIFIRSTGDTIYDWQAVTNILSYPSGSKVFEFGILPDSNTCYIQFPKDIASLVNATIEIRFIISNGKSGSIKANTLTEFLNDETVFNDKQEKVTYNDKVRVIQTDVSYGNEDPETIQDAYKNYKKTIGTFNTLITKKDYENFLYNLKDNVGYVTSNCVVTDRTNDVNLASKVITWNGVLNKTEYIVAENENTNEDSLTPYDIVLYSLNPGDGTYDSTFEPNIDSTITSILKNASDEVKAIEHNMHDFSDLNSISNGFICLLKNISAITGRIVTYQKVTKDEAKEIETNVQYALSQQYNARNVEFGKELDYNNLIDTITSADARIKTVALDIPRNQIYKVGTNTKGESAISQNTLSIDDKLTIVAKMILSGNVQLFNFNTSFDYDFGQTNVQSYGSATNPIKTITTQATISNSATSNALTSTNGYTLKSNEIVQLCAPNYITTKEYSTYVRFNFFSNSTASIPEKVDYKLKDAEYIKVTYKDQNNNTQTDTLNPGTIINCNFRIDRSTETTNMNTFSTYKYILESGQSLAVKELNTHEIPANAEYIYIVNNTDNTLMFSNSAPKILEEGEFFAYRISPTDGCIILESGTKLTAVNAFEAHAPKIIDFDAAIDGSKPATWEKLSNPITVTELDIVTISSGAKIKASKDIEITNTFKDIGDTIITINENETFTTVGDGVAWQIRSRLTLNTNINKPQPLASNHTINITYKDGSTTNNIKNVNLVFNSPVVLSGGNNMDASVWNPLTGDYTYELVGYSYTGESIKRDKAQLLTYTSDTTNANVVTLNYTFKANSRWLLPVYTVQADKNSFSLKAGSTTLKLFNNGATTTKPGFNLFEITTTTALSNLVISHTKGGTDTSTDAIQIGKLHEILGINKDEIEVISSSDNNYSAEDNFVLDSIYTGTQTIEQALLSRIEQILQESKKSVVFNYTYTVKPIDKVLQPTLSFQ